MINNKKIIAVIPARGGSKRLPRKNILELSGKPLIAWAIEAAFKSKYIDEVMVSTDDIEIADIARKYKAVVPFLRPEEISNDKATTFDAVKHVINFYKKELNNSFDFVLLLQPTSPLRSQIHIDEAIELLEKKNAETIISVCESEHPLAWYNSLPHDNNMSSFVKNMMRKEKNLDLKKSYRINGAIYISNIKKLLQKKSFFISDRIFAYIMEKEASVDIDDMFDFKFAQFILSV